MGFLQCAREPVLQRGQALVFVDAGAGAVADRRRCRCGRGQSPGLTHAAQSLNSSSCRHRPRQSLAAPGPPRCSRTSWKSSRYARPLRGARPVRDLYVRLFAGRLACPCGPGGSGRAAAGCRCRGNGRCHPLGQCLVVGNQAVAPLLGCMRAGPSSRRPSLPCAARPGPGAWRPALRFGVELAHELADVLHLAALAFEIGDALGFGQGIHQLVGQFQALNRSVRSVSSSLPRSCRARRISRLRSVLAGLGRAFEFGLELIGRVRCLRQRTGRDESSLFWVCVTWGRGSKGQRRRRSALQWRLSVS